MSWVALVMELEAREADTLSDELLARGALSVTTEDAAAGTPDEHAIFDEPGENPSTWPRLVLRMMAADEPTARALLQEACDACGMDIPDAVGMEHIPEQDWVRTTQAQFDTIRVSDRLWIVPTWHTPPKAAAINIRLDPGVAFGTGSHPTTRLCLEWLDAHLRPGQTVLDYGCGSGILAIAALKLGAGRTLGTDIDPAAIEAARANCAANEVTCEFTDAAASLNYQADVVLANILANPLKVLAPALAGHCRTGGHLVLAGILSHQAEEIAAIYARWFEIDRLVESEGWTRVSGTRRAEPC